MEAGFARQDAKFQWTFGIILTSWLSTWAPSASSSGLHHL